jgi:hypothetical protein
MRTSTIEPDQRSATIRNLREAPRSLQQRRRHPPLRTRRYRCHANQTIRGTCKILDYGFAMNGARIGGLLIA